jgi:hypothetical protein
MRKLRLAWLTLLTFFAVGYLFAAVAHAAALVGTDGSIGDLLRPVYDAIIAGDYAFAIASAIVLLAAVLRRWGSKVLPWFGTQPGGVAILMIGSFGASLSTALAAGEPISWDLVYGAFKTAAVAGSLYSWLKRLVIDPLRPWMETKAPAPLRYVYLAVAWVFDRVVPPVPQDPSDETERAA